MKRGTVAMGTAGPIFIQDRPKPQGYGPIDPVILGTIGPIVVY